MAGLDEGLSARTESGTSAHRSPPSRAPAESLQVREFRQILLWPLELMHPEKAPRIEDPAKLIGAGPGRASPWSEIWDEFPDDPAHFRERHYREFVTFHPHVQRFLYGAPGSAPGAEGTGGKHLRIFRRHDVAAARFSFQQAQSPLVVTVERVDLYFLYDVDVVILAVEIVAPDVALTVAQELLYRFGRAYPGGWTAAGTAEHCLGVEWLDAGGNVLAASDYDVREKFVGSVRRHRVPAIAAHWEYLLAPLTINRLPGGEAVGLRLIEYYRMPQLSFMAIEDVHWVDRNDYMRIALAAAPAAAGGEPPFAQGYLADFEQRYCYDRYHDPQRADGWTDTRVLCSGQSFAMLGDARQPFVTDRERGALAQFRQQYFLLGLILHFHRAALLMLADRLVRIINRLDLDQLQSVARFRGEVRATQALFLRFTHRYWFLDVTDKSVGRDLYRMWAGHLETERLYASVRAEIQDMSQYLDSDMLRRTSRTMVRLTVVAILSLIGTATTGFLGMNLISEADAPLPVKVSIFLAVAALATALTMFTVYKARPLADFLDTLADERSGWRRRLTAFGAVWRKR